MTDLSKVMAWFAVTLAAVGMAVAQSPSPGNAERKAAPPVRTLIPAEHTLYFHANMVEIAKNPALAEIMTTVTNHLVGLVKAHKAMPLVNVLGLSAENLVDVHLSADLRQSRQGLGDMIAIFQFKADVDLENVVALSRRRTDGEGQTVFQTEMINGQIVFVHELSEWSVMQVSPKVILISSRATMKRVTKLRRANSLARNGVVTALIKANGGPYSFAGIVTTVPGAELPFETMRFVLPSKSADVAAPVQAVMRGKSRRASATLASAIEKDFGPVFQRLKVVQAGATVQVELNPTSKGLESLFRAMSSKGLLKPRASSRGETTFGHSTGSPAKRGDHED